jgi:head-tail adaptor
MSFGKMNQRVEIRNNSPSKDADGFLVSSDTVLAIIRAYRENQHGNEKWANMAVFSSATALFRFRVIPNLKVTTDMIIVCKGERFQILSVEDVRNRGMYLEVLAEKVEGSKK